MKKIVSAPILVVIFLSFIILLNGCQKTLTVANNTPEQEATAIKTWVTTMKNQKYHVDSTASGIYYIMTKTGTGNKISAGQNITVAYTGRFMNGDSFDASLGFSYIHKSSQSRMIDGWEEAVELLNLGAAGTFCFPSSLAYGANGYMMIPPYSALLFDLEITEIK